MATTPQRVPFASKSEDKSESTAESLRPAGSVSKFENDEEKRFDFTRSIFDAKESISSALRSNTPPSISSNSLWLIEGVAVESRTLGAVGVCTLEDECSENLSMMFL